MLAEPTDGAVASPNRGIRRPDATEPVPTEPTVRTARAAIPERDARVAIPERDARDWTGSARIARDSRSRCGRCRFRASNRRDSKLKATRLAPAVQRNAPAKTRARA